MCCILIHTSKITNRTRLLKTSQSIGYLKNTAQLPLVAGTDSNGILTCMLSLSAKQKSNKKNSIEAGFAEADNTMTFVILMKDFFVSQVRSININV